MITDHELIAASSYRALIRARRVYVATWTDGTQERFAVASLSDARVYAREWGIRIRGGTPISVRWDR